MKRLGKFNSFSRLFSLEHLALNNKVLLYQLTSPIKAQPVQNWAFNVVAIFAINFQIRKAQHVCRVGIWLKVVAAFCALVKSPNVTWWAEYGPFEFGREKKTACIKSISKWLATKTSFFKVRFSSCECKNWQFSCHHHSHREQRLFFGKIDIKTAAGLTYSVLHVCYTHWVPQWCHEQQYPFL